MASSTYPGPRSPAIRAILLIGLLLGTAALAPGVSAAPPPDVEGSVNTGGAWTVSADEFRYNQTIDLSGSLTIDGASLTLVNTTLIMNGTLNGELDVQLINGGALILASPWGGSSRLLGYGGALPDIIMGNGSLKLDRGYIECFDLSLDGGVIDLDNGTLVSGGTIQLDNALVVDLTAMDIHCASAFRIDSSDGVLVKGNTLTLIGGLEMTDSGDCRISDTVFSGFSAHGLSSTWGLDRLSLVNCSFVGPSCADCIHILNSPDMVMRDITINGGRNGTYLLNAANAVVRGMDISGAMIGVNIGSSGGLVLEDLNVVGCYVQGIQTQYCHGVNMSGIHITGTPAGIRTSSDRYMAFDNVTVSGATQDGFRASIMRDSGIRDSTLGSDTAVSLFYGSNIELDNVTVSGSTGLDAEGTAFLDVRKLDTSHISGYGVAALDLEGANFENSSMGGAVADIRLTGANATFRHCERVGSALTVELDKGSWLGYFSGEGISKRTFRDNASSIDEGWTVKLGNATWVGSQVTMDTTVSVRDRMGNELLDEPLISLPMYLDVVSVTYMQGPTVIDHNPLNVICYQPGEKRYSVDTVTLNTDIAVEPLIMARAPVEAELSTTPLEPLEGDVGFLNVTIFNNGSLKVQDLEITVSNGGENIYSEVVDSLDANSSIMVKLNHLFTSNIERISVSLDHPDPVRGQYPVHVFRSFDRYVNDRPVARIISSTDQVYTYGSMVFSGATSSDNQSIAYYWFDFDDGTNSSWVGNPYISHVYIHSGEYHVSLKVMDTCGVESYWSVPALVEILDSPPKAGINVSESVGYYNTSFRFTSTSTDIDGTVSSWFWEFGDGSVSSQRDPTHIYYDDGTFLVRLFVMDNEGASSGTVSTSIRVYNTWPHAVFTLSNSTPLVGQNVTLDAADSGDPDDTELNITWNLGDGNISGRLHLVHAWEHSGNFTVTLSIRDDDGAVALFSLAINVSDPPPPPPPVNTTNTTNITVIPPPRSVGRNQIYILVGSVLLLALLLMVLATLLVVKHMASRRARARALEEARRLQDAQLLQMNRKGTPHTPIGPPRPRLTYYNVLDINPFVSPAEIKKAYRRKIKEFHPDRFSGSTDEERDLAKVQVKMINKAKFWLMDPDRRNEYDEFLGFESHSEVEEDEDDGFFDDLDEDFDAFQRVSDEEVEEEFTGSIIPDYAMSPAIDPIYEETSDPSPGAETYVMEELTAISPVSEDEQLGVDRNDPA